MIFLYIKLEMKSKLCLSNNSKNFKFDTTIRKLFKRYKTNKYTYKMLK